MSALDYAVELTEDEIVEAQGATRARGVYDEAFEAFLESGKRGIGIAPGSGPFAGKKAANIKSGLDNARKRMVGEKSTATDEQKTAAGLVKVIIHTDNEGTESVRVFRNEQAAD